jgi:hypothetical protein
MLKHNHDNMSESIISHVPMIDLDEDEEYRNH